jgi:L-amino acid N-acyltransferase YncA
MIRPCRPSDVLRICEIHNRYVRETVITFEEEPVEEREMARRVADVSAASIAAKHQDPVGP